jgi:hypothetical protein
MTHHPAGSESWPFIVGVDVAGTKYDPDPAGSYARIPRPRCVAFAPPATLSVDQRYL